jgi:hypothetical protein
VPELTNLVGSSADRRDVIRLKEARTLTGSHSFARKNSTQN